MAPEISPREAEAIALYQTFARISDPRQLEYRWSRLKPAAQQQYRDEADAVIDTFLQHDR